MRPTLLQPKAAVKGDADAILYSAQRGEFKLVWVDECKLEHYIIEKHVNRSQTHITPIVEAACRQEAPVIMAGHNRPAWRRNETHQLMIRAGLIQSEHS